MRMLKWAALASLASGVLLACGWNCGGEALTIAGMFGLWAANGGLARLGIPGIAT